MPKQPKRIPADEQLSMRLLDNAADCAWSSEYLLRSDVSITTRHLMPSIVLDALAIELLLKTLDAILTRSYLPIHDLDSLFAGLPEAARSDLERRWKIKSTQGALAVLYPGGAGEFSMESFLKE